MQAGNSNFPILVTNISGSPVLGLSTVNFDIDGQVGTTIINSGTVTASLSADGYYLVNVDIPVGQGFLKVSSISASHYVTPTFYNIDATLYDADDVYASIARQTLDITQVAVSSYETQEIGPFKQGDDWVINYIIPDSVTTSISGYSNFKASLWDDSILTSVSGSEGYIGDFTLTIDVPTKSVQMKLDDTYTVNLVSEGLTEEYYYSDLQATDTGGNKITLAEFSILARRQFTRG